MRHAQIQRITTCGSGHFLLGAFDRLHRRWQDAAPGLGARELVKKALDGVYGVDINPFAVAIARFRLLVAAMHAAGDRTIELDIDYQPHLASGDSLLWGATTQVLDDDMLGLGFEITPDVTEDVAALTRILRRQHDVVVGNPPYISIKDAALRDTYRHLYKACHGKYVLSVPFMELFFSLAHPAEQSRPTGWIGKITSNSFMKREFGVKLVEKFLARHDLRKIIDTSGAYIPGHGTPTVILVGRNQQKVSDTALAVLGIRGEPGRPADASKGLVWSSITEHHGDVGYEGSYISVVDMPQEALRLHPWSLSGGGALELAQMLESKAATRLEKSSASIGIMSFTLEDDVFIQPSAVLDRRHVSSVRPMVVGDELRDWGQRPHDFAIFPYDDTLTALNSLDQLSGTYRFMWGYRSILADNKMFGNQTKIDAGLKWYEFGRLTTSKLAAPNSITFAEVATHNHFVFDRGGKVFKHTAPVVKLPVGASVDDHMRLLGLLNSSVACFWLKQNCHNKGGSGIGRGIADEDWEPRYQYNGTTVKDFPVPATTPAERPALLDSLARELQHQTPAELATRETPTTEAIGLSKAESDRLRRLMIANQEELDWEYYRIYGLIDEDLTYDGDLPGIALGERTFEIALARRMRDGEHTAWFERHGSAPITEIPDHLPADYRELMQRRLDAIESNPHIRLLEKPEYR